MKRKLHYLTTYLFLLLLSAGTMTACNGGGSKSAAVTAETAVAFDEAPAAAADNVWMDGGFYEQDEALYEEEGNFYEESNINTSAKPMTPPELQNQSSSQSALDRKLIRTVSLNTETTGFDSLMENIRQSVLEKGGYIEQSDISGASISSGLERRRNAYLMVRIPSTYLDQFVSQMGEQSNITSRSENVQDVTLQYTDIESRKKSLTIEQERLWALLEKADTLEAVIALEERLSEIRYQLEGFESQLRTFDNQVNYSTIHIYIQEVGVFTPTVPDSVGARIQKGFIRNLESVSNSLVDFLVWLLSHLPTFVVLGIIIGIIILPLAKIKAKRKLKSIAAFTLEKPEGLKTEASDINENHTFDK
ncbi:MAG: DUF4349 domain-containing protein [Lachnospiraceae bacterium]|nr:DUF4349 domain-containing protein [Lachnospiraceae bacterium]